MNARATKVVRCAIYTRVSTDQGLEQDFNSLDAQYDASQAYIRSQAHAGWSVCAENLDSAILVMKAAENRSRRDGAEPLNRPMDGGVLVQSAMRP